ncbi:hypothetical protein MPL3356_350086 [Mesorhizobium plurifarium]|uniref:Uncharacterized protein n=1 Tax=Mesorhizobium plurifarium TaxID=69974 RepID=A0A090DWH0_MESPL|nr:hypothetical protein MPL3356_350086 [Mesorhizobium plurifarium]
MPSLALASGLISVPIENKFIHVSVYSPDGWRVLIPDQPKLVLANPKLLTAALLDSGNPKLKGEVRVLEKGQLDAATVFSAVAEQTLNARIAGADRIVGNQDVGAFRVKYVDSAGNTYVEQFVTAERFAVSILVFMDRGHTPTDEKAVAAILNASKVVIDRP